jgi:hypothetical protein
VSERLSTCTDHEDKFVVVYHGTPWDCPDGECFKKIKISYNDKS